jgi:hypothetical protein
MQGTKTADTSTVRLFRRARRLHARTGGSSSALEQAELAALHETTLALLDRLNLEDLLETIVERAGGLVGAPRLPLSARARRRGTRGGFCQMRRVDIEGRSDMPNASNLHAWHA